MSLESTKEKKAKDNKKKCSDFLPRFYRSNWSTITATAPETVTILQQQDSNKT